MEAKMRTGITIVRQMILVVDRSSAKSLGESVNANSSVNAMHSIIAGKSWKRDD
jgi:hypothetical protein